MGDVELLRGELLVVAAQTELAESVAFLRGGPGQKLLWQYLETVSCALCTDSAVTGHRRQYCQRPSQIGLSPAQTVLSLPAPSAPAIVDFRLTFESLTKREVKIENASRRAGPDDEHSAGEGRPKQVRKQKVVLFFLVGTLGALLFFVLGPVHRVRKIVSTRSTSWTHRAGTSCTDPTAPAPCKAS